MNEEVILKMVKPYLKDNSVTYYEFDNIFSFLSRKEQYEVTNLLDRNGISLIPDDEKENVDILDKSDILNSKSSAVCEDKNYNEIKDQVAKLETSKDFKILYDDTVFSDGEGLKSDFQIVNKNIKQSNNILCRLIQEGNKQAEQDLCIKNKRLVDKEVSIYGKTFGNSLTFEDLEQVGMIGLLKAAKRFDYMKGYQFSTYAIWWVRQSITREIEENGFVIRIPAHMMELISKIVILDNKYGSMGMDFHGRVEKIHSETCFDVEKIKYCLILKNNYLSNISLNTPIGEEKDIEVQDMICDNENLTVEQIIESRDLHRCLLNDLNTLKEREKNILISRFGLLDGRARTLEEVAKQYNVTRERIRQIEAKALKKLRHPSRIKKLKGFLY